MLPPVPDPLDYDISPDNGFLPGEVPLQHLPHPAYDKWERIINNFQSLLLSKRLRSVIDTLPVLPTSHLDTEPEWRRAYVLLVFMAHGYIWGGEKPAERLPPSITYPLLSISNHLEVPPVATYAGVCLWNWKPIFLSENVSSLENLSTLNTFTGSLDEQWFYLVSVTMEAKGGPTIPMMMKAMQAARNNDVEVVLACLQSLADTIDELGSLLVRMYESCDPHVFYHRIRPYLAGSKNMKEAGLPNGVFYDEGNGCGTWRQYSGGSNAQSSLIQFFDVVLGVEHRPTGEKRSGAETSESEAEGGRAPAPRHNFIQEMRSYMPGPHRRFLQDLEKVANIREFVEANRHNRRLVLAYDASLGMLKALRDKHIQMVSRYIIVKSRERSVSRTRGRQVDRDAGSPQAARQKPMNLASAKYQPSSKKNDEFSGGSKKQRGTGGTALIPFLKQARDETGEIAMDEWSRSYLNGGRPWAGDKEIANENKIHDTLAQAGDLPPGEIVGLAGSWDMEDNGGGLCAF